MRLWLAAQPICTISAEALPGAHSSLPAVVLVCLGTDGADGHLQLFMIAVTVVTRP